VIDTSGITIDQQVEMAEDYARGVAGRLAEKRASYRKDSSPLFITHYFRVTRKILYILLKLLFGLRVFGRENLEIAGNFLFASNHISYADPPVVGSSFNREVWFLAKKELFNNRFFGWLIRKYHAVPIDRNSFDRKAIRTIVKLLKSGHSVLMFPEGTRSRDGSIKKPKEGLGYITINSGADIIPVYIKGSDRMLRALLRKDSLEVHIGPPIYIGGEYESDDRKRDYRLISSMVYQSIRMLKNEA
jgi:1-acyl-sn-glycerol-3-phosphate acyltransferase